MAERLRRSSRVRMVRCTCRTDYKGGPEPPQDPVTAVARHFGGGPSPVCGAARGCTTTDRPHAPTHDRSPDEIESRRRAATRTWPRHACAGLTVQGLRPRRRPAGPGRGRRHRHAVRRLPVRLGRRRGRPGPARRARGPAVHRRCRTRPTRPRLYTPEDLAAGFAERGFAGMYDTVVYRHFRGARRRAAGRARGARPADARPRHRQRAGRRHRRLGWPRTAARSVGHHGRARRAARRRRVPARPPRSAGGWPAAGRLVVTGGGPGRDGGGEPGRVPGHGRPADDLAAAIDVLAAAPDFHDHDPYTAAALAVRRAFHAAAETATDADVVGWARHGGLAVPTWLYGHEPANLFAARIAKYFSNAIREDTILRLARGGIVVRRRAGPAPCRRSSRRRRRRSTRTDGPAGRSSSSDARSGRGAAGGDAAAAAAGRVAARRPDPPHPHHRRPGRGGAR